MIKNQSLRGASKNIETKYHFIRQEYDNGLCGLEYIASEHQAADIFTKKAKHDMLKSFTFYTLSTTDIIAANYVSDSNER